MTEQKMLLPASPNEKLLAAASHAAIIVPGLGFIIPLVIWITQRGKSAYTTFQALQGLGYQILFMLFYGLVSAVGAVLMIGFILLGTMLASTTAIETAMPWVTVVAELLGFGFIFGVSALYVLVGLVGAVLCLTGGAFHYPFFGAALERYLTRPVAAPITEATNA